MDRSKKIENIPTTIYGIRSYYGSGLTWIMNFLLEIDILVCGYYSADKKCKDYDGMWKKVDDKKRIFNYNPYRIAYKQLLPILSRKSEFIFRDNLEIQWSHNFPNTDNSNQKIILSVRDGRDTLYSQYKREFKNETLQKMLKSPLQYQFGNYNSITLAPADMWGLLYLLWVELIPKENLLIIRFEQIKSEPLIAVQRILDFLGITRTHEEITCAIENSSFEKAREAENLFLKNHPKYQPIMLKGKSCNIKEVYGQEELSFFSGLPKKILERFGYDVSTIEEHNKNTYPLFPSDSFEILADIAKKELLLAESDLEKIYFWGGIFTCQEWAQELFKYDEVKQKLIFKALLQAFPLFNDKIFFTVATASALFNYGQKQTALYLADHYFPQITDQKSLHRILFLYLRTGRLMYIWQFFKKSGFISFVFFVLFVIWQFFKKFIFIRRIQELVVVYVEIIIKFLNKLFI